VPPSLLVRADKVIKSRRETPFAVVRESGNGDPGIAIFFYAANSHDSSGPRCGFLAAQ
jgi:hypothetical protein